MRARHRNKPFYPLLTRRVAVATGRQYCKPIARMQHKQRRKVQLTRVRQVELITAGDAAHRIGRGQDKGSVATVP